eukprot:gene2259-4386_t
MIAATADEVRVLPEILAMHSAKVQKSTYDAPKVLDDLKIIRISFGEITVGLASIDGTIQMISSEAQGIFEQPPAMLFGQNLNNMLSTGYEVMELHRFRNSAIVGEGQQSALLRIRSGVILWVDAYSIPLGSFAYDFYGFASRRQWSVTSKTMNAILGLEVFTTEYHSFLRYATKNKSQLSDRPLRRRPSKLQLYSYARQCRPDGLAVFESDSFCNFQFDDECEWMPLML